MKTLQIILWCLVVLASGAAAYLWLNQYSRIDTVQQAERLGGDFELIRNDGTTITQDDFAGRRHALFFGFTHCPEICPTTLMEAAGWLQKLGNDADALDFYFVTVDPARDTKEVLNDFVMAFDERITGLTGKPANIERFLKDYKVYAQKVDLGDGDYTMDHSAFVMLFDGHGEFKGTISYGENQDIALAKLKKLIENE